MSEHLKLLLLEDESTSASLLIEELAAGGFHVRFDCARTPQAMLAILAESQWDIILAGENLGGKNSPETLRLLRAHHPDIPVIVITQQHDSQHTQELLKAGATASIPSGTLDQLTATVQQVLEAARIQQANKKITRQLEEQQRKMATLAANLPGAAYRCLNEPSWTMECITQGVSDLTGYDPEDFLPPGTVKLGDLIHPDDRGNVWETVQAAIANKEPFKLVYRIHTRNGDEKWVWEQGRGIYSSHGELAALEGYISDITSLRAAEAERDLFRNAIEQAGDLILVTDANGVIEHANPIIEELTGYRRDEVIGHSFRLFKNGEDDTLVYKHFMDALEKGERWTGRLNLRRKDGDLFESETVVSPAFNAGQCTHHVLVVRDVTKEAEYQQQLRRVQKMEAIGSLASGIAHDFNNVLSSIIGYTKFAHEQLGPEQKQIREDLELALKASERARHLVQQLLTFSRKTKHERRSVQPHFVIREVLDLLGPALPATIEIRENIASDCGLIHADPAELNQVVMNLCTNAYQAMTAEGGVLTITLQSGQASVFGIDGEPEDAVAVIEVSDTGCGIDPNMTSRIFEPFFTTKAADTGTGLGLSVVHGIVSELGGLISVESEPDRGTTFRVVLPATTEIDTVIDTRDAELHGGNEHVLVVDDEVLLANMIRRILEGVGYKVTMVTSAVDALAELYSYPERFDLIIADVTMPVMTGEELLLEALSIKPSLPSILITGYSDRQLSEQLEGVVNCTLLPKPFDNVQLAATVRRALDRETVTASV